MRNIIFLSNYVLENYTTARIVFRISLYSS